GLVGAHEPEAAIVDRAQQVVLLTRPEARPVRAPREDGAGQDPIGRRRPLGHVARRAREPVGGPGGPARGGEKRLAMIRRAAPHGVRMDDGFAVASGGEEDQSGGHAARSHFTLQRASLSGYAPTANDALVSSVTASSATTAPGPVWSPSHTT